MKEKLLMEKAEVVRENIQVNQQVNCLKKKVKKNNRERWTFYNPHLTEKDFDDCAPWLKPSK